MMKTFTQWWLIPLIITFSSIWWAARRLPTSNVEKLETFAYLLDLYLRLALAAILSLASWLVWALLR